MGIYINMEMPTEEELGKCIIVRHDGEVLIVEFDNLIDGGYVACYPTKPTRAVPVPPHGDLIERKAIFLTDFEIAMCDGDYKEGMKMLLEKVESAPSIIPAEPQKEE